MVHSHTSTWVYWTTETAFKIVVVVALLHSITAAAYIHMFLFCFFFVWKCIRIDTGVYGLADSGREDPDGERGGLLAKTQRHVPLLRREVKGLIFLSFHFCWIFFSPHPPFKTNSHISLAKNLEVEGSSRWCRACLGRTWRTCNPEADLERVEPHFHWSVNVIIRGKVGEKKQSNMGASIKGWAEKLPMQTGCSDHQLRPGNVGHTCWILDPQKKHVA